MSKFIDLERLSSTGLKYERNLVNISHIVRIEKLEKSENSKVVVHLIDGTKLTPNRTYESLRKDLENGTL